MTRIDQKGSIVSFVVVGVVLTALVLGGLYVVKERNFFGLGQAADDVAQTTDDTISDVTDGNDESAEPDTTTQDDPATTDNTDTTTDTDQVQTDAPDTAVSNDADDAEQPATDDSDATVTESEQTETPATSNDDAETLPQTGMVADELPQTGPSDAFVAAIGLSALLASILAYRRSFQL